MTNLVAKVHASAHAVERARQRFGAKGTADNVAHTLRQWFTRAVYKGREPRGKIYDNVAKDVRLIMDETAQTVITVYRLSTVDDHVAAKLAPKITVQPIKDAIMRQYQRMTTELRREVRKLNEQVAELKSEAYAAERRYWRAKNPLTQASIKANVDALLAQADELAHVIDAKLTQIETAGREVKAVVGE